MIGNDWDNILRAEYQKDYFQKLIKFVDTEYQRKIIYPEYNQVFRAFKETAYQNVKVVILGQDPYHGENRANGLSFSVNEGISYPPSLRNIFKELQDDLKIVKNSSDLSSWAKEGVLLLNSVLTVEKDMPASHKGRGLEEFTDNVIKKVNEKDSPVVFILWGSFAKSKKKLITNKYHLIIESAHPSPLSAYQGFFGSKPFSRTNKFLEDNAIKKIRW